MFMIRGQPLLKDFWKVWVHSGADETRDNL